MNTVTSSVCAINLFADEWQAREVAELARYAIRRCWAQCGGIYYSCSTVVDLVIAKGG